MHEKESKVNRRERQKRAIERRSECLKVTTVQPRQLVVIDNLIEGGSA